MFAAVTLFSAPVGAQSLPPMIQKAVSEQIEICKPEKPQIGAGFVSRKDINGDGVSDYVLDYGSFSCGGTRLFCGSAGCLTQVFASTDGTFVKVLDENVRDLAFKTIKSRPAMLVGLHGGSCGKRGVDPCGATLYWNGSKFSPAH